MGTGYLSAMVRRAVPAGCGVVKGSTPVIAFGDPLSARVATLGINPSSVEFLDRGRLLCGANRRLSTLESLGLKQIEDADDVQVAAVVDECANYFRHNPYWQWFGPLDEVLVAGTGCSYRNGTACHLDLVQWATDPVWSGLSDPVRAKLIEDGVGHLVRQLAESPVHAVVMNGATVISQVRACGLVDLVEVGEIVERTPNRSRAWKLVLGSADGVHYFGWTGNLQSPYRAGPQVRVELAAWLAGQLKTVGAPASPGDAHRPVGAERTRTERRPRRPSGPPPGATRGTEGFVAKGTTVHSKSELMQLLRGWLESSTEATIGDASRYAGTPWVRIEINGREAVLNADTTRSAVEAFLRDGADRLWSVVANTRGRWNKVTFRTDGRPTPGWYCYLTEEARAGVTL
jgi:hypothetical protein